MTKRKRLAIMYSGQPRNIEECIRNHRKKIHKANPHWDIDIFVHFLYTEDKRQTIPKSQTKGQWLESEKELERVIRKHWQPKGFIIERRIPPASPFDEDKNNPPPWRTKEHTDVLTHPLTIKHGNTHLGPNVPAMFYSIHMACVLKQAYEKEHGFIYDCAMRLRTDVYFRRQWPWQADNYDLNVLHASYYAWEKDHDICDFMWFANSSLMDRSCSLFTRMPEVIHAVQTKYLTHCKDGERVTGERLIGVYLKFFEKIIVKNLVLKFTLFRFVAQWRPLRYAFSRFFSRMWLRI